MRVRMMALTLALFGASASAYAQNVEPPSVSCWAVAIKGQVRVTRIDGTIEKGTLACLGTDQIVLAGTGAIPLDSIRRIEKPRDGILDGFLKGASVGLVFLIMCGGDCDAGIVARTTLSYAVLGAAIDAAQGNNPTIYRREPASPSLAWRVRF